MVFLRFKVLCITPVHMYVFLPLPYPLQVIFVLTFRRNGAGINFVSNLYRYTHVLLLQVLVTFFTVKHTVCSWNVWWSSQKLLKSEVGGYKFGG